MCIRATEFSQNFFFKQKSIIKKLNTNVDFVLNLPHRLLHLTNWTSRNFSWAEKTLVPQFISSSTATSTTKHYSDRKLSWTMQLLKSNCAAPLRTWTTSAFTQVVIQLAEENVLSKYKSCPSDEVEIESKLLPPLLLLDDTEIPR